MFLKKFRKIIMLIVTTIVIILLGTFSKAIDEGSAHGDNTLKLEYEYNAEENTVMAKMVSNIELKDTKPTWTLSEDKKAYTKIFSENNNYSTQVEDVNGEKRNVQINVTDVIIANLKVEYQYDNTRNVVIVKVISDLELKDTKPSWTLSEDKLVYIKEFGDNSR